MPRGCTVQYETGASFPTRSCFQNQALYDGNYNMCWLYLLKLPLSIPRKFCLVCNVLCRVGSAHICQKTSFSFCFFELSKNFVYIYPWNLKQMCFWDLYPLLQAIYCLNIIKQVFDVSFSRSRDSRCTSDRLWSFNIVFLRRLAHPLPTKRQKLV